MGSIGIETSVDEFEAATLRKDYFPEPKTKYNDWRDEFNKYGCVVIKGVISPEKAEYYRKKQMEWLKSFPLGFDENDESTWTAEHLPASFKGGMYSAYGSSHEKCVWEARTEPKVVEIFETLWGTKELLCSFDGFNISLPRRKDLKWTPWPHCDQNPAKKGMQAVQGLLNYAPNGPKDGGLILMKGSSKLFDDFFARDRDPYDHEDAPPPEMKFMDLFLFSQADTKWFTDRGCELIKINMEPGDFVLWDSRTMHYACLPEADQIRQVQYICMTPRSMAPPDQLKIKAECFEKRIGTTHWPHCNINPSGPPMRDGKICPHNRSDPADPPIVTQQILRLAGVEAY
ncbi:hypothetical protein BP5796_03549 [Coleophoma crateriformis]|uniref:Clavaminate synthase-like protein n=1 Tax=Coleophoma crateriformis TaxID=565419 RepID=A0A3D8SNF6_9HELO|nr:hypothetical protein BP5796_03549 [Coleophoma crateriformis]